MQDFRMNTFLSVCRTLNYTRSAAELNITQPAVSQHIAYLEKAYGAKLLSYHGKKLTLTPAGELLRDAAATMAHDEATLRDAIAALAGPRRRLKVGHDAHRRRVRAGGAASALPGGPSRGAGAHRLVRHRAPAGAVARRRDRLRARGGVLRQELLRLARVRHRAPHGGMRTRRAACPREGAPALRGPARPAHPGAGTRLRHACRARACPGRPEPLQWRASRASRR